MNKYLTIILYGILGSLFGGFLYSLTTGRDFELVRSVLFGLLFGCLWCVWLRLRKT